MNVIIFTDVKVIGFGKYAGPYKVATELRNAGFTVQVIDYFTRPPTQKLKNLIDQFVNDDTYWIGFSTTFSRQIMNRPAEEITTSSSVSKNRVKQQAFTESFEEIIGRDDIKELIAYARANNPKLKVLGGGANARMLREHKEIDHVVVGQAETSVVALTNAIKNNETVPRLITEKDFPYDGFTNSIIEWQPQDIIMPGENLPIEFSRGCIFKCKFCNYPLLGKKLWDFVKPPELIAAEMQRNYDMFGTKGYLVTDDTVNDSVEKVESLHREITKLPFDLTLSAYARLDLIITHPHTLDLLYEMGFRSFLFGIESLNYESAKAIGKGMHPDKIKKGIEDLKTRYPDILISLSLIFGLPHETKETMRNAIEYFKVSPADNITLSPYFINPESTIGQNPSAFNYVVNGPQDWRNEHVSWQDCEDLTREADLVLNKRNKLSWMFLNRILNCGYTVKECQEHTLFELSNEIRNRAKTNIQNYFKSLHNFYL